MIEYTNRKGQVYYLHHGMRKNGARHFYFSKTRKDEFLQRDIPDGYEIYEKPTTAQVYLRKTVPSRITDAQIESARQLIREWCHLPDYAIRTDREGSSIVLYATDRSDFLPPANPPTSPNIIPMPGITATKGAGMSETERLGMSGLEDQLVELLGQAQRELFARTEINPGRPQIPFHEKMIKCGGFEPSLRFELLSDDDQPRGKNKATPRFEASRYHFSLNGWYQLERGELDALIRKYVPHVGRESFFELM